MSLKRYLRKFYLILYKRLPDCSSEVLQSFIKNFSVESKYSKILFSTKTCSLHTKWQEIFPNLDPNGIDLISKMLAIDPHKRISAIEALNHDFLRE